MFEVGDKVRHINTNGVYTISDIDCNGLIGFKGYENTGHYNPIYYVLFEKAKIDIQKAKELLEENGYKVEYTEIPELYVAIYSNVKADGTILNYTSGNVYKDLEKLQNIVKDRKNFIAIVGTRPIVKKAGNTTIHSCE